MNLSDPFTKEELIKTAGTLKENLREAFENVYVTLFFQKPEKGWSLAENVQHMNRVTKLMTFSFFTPKFLSTAIFGENPNKARRTLEVAEVYLDALAKGQGSGPFTPGSESTEGNLSERKQKLLDDWNKQLDKYAKALEIWDEKQLDGILMPHPFLGKIPAREMYMVGILHPVHHCRIVSKRLGLEWKYF